MRVRNPLAFAFVAVLAAIATGCSHANFDPAPAGSIPTVAPSTSASPNASATPVASATPSGSTTVAPLSCGTPVAGAVYVAMGSYIEPAPSPDPSYGPVYGYSIVDSGGNYPLQASPIVLRPGDLVQFTDVDPPAADSSDGTSHSAAGLQMTGFPAQHVFPNAAAGEVGLTFSNSTLWSTGEIPAEIASLCYSQTFTVPASGTYYFGDVDFYNTVNMRDVLIVSSTAAQ